MRKFFLLQMIMLIALMFLSQGMLSAQGTGGLKGKVVDESSGDPLPGANVYIDGTAMGSATDLSGNYRIMNVPPGTYDLIVTFIGYNKKTVSVQVAPGQVLEQDIQMAFSVIDLGQAVTISAQRVGQVGAINRQLTSDALMNAVAADRIQELPDANVAESIGRIPGVSIEREGGEASKVVIRGLEPKLNAITVNGIKVPATSSGTASGGSKHNVSDDQGDRAVDLSMMSSELLEAIEVFKAPTPDMDAEAIGGIVNLRVKKAPNQRTILFRGNGGYNQLNNEYSDYKFVSQYSQRFLNKSIGVIGGLNVEKTNRGSERYSASYDTDGVVDTTTGIVPVAGQRMSIRDTQEDRKRIGGYLTIDYAFETGVIWFTNFYSKTSRNPFSVTKHYRPRDQGITYDVRYQEIDLSGLSSSLNGEHHILGMDIDWVLSRYATQTNNSYDMEMEFYGYGNYDESILDRDDVDTYVPAARDSLNTIYLRNNYFRPDTTAQTDYTAELNFKVPYSISSKLSGFIKFGGKYSQSSRERMVYGAGIADYYQGGDIVADAQALYPGHLDINGQGRIAGSNFVTSATGQNKIINNQYVLSPLFDQNKMTDWYSYQKSLFNSERYSLSDAYDLRETLTAGYVMTKLNVGQKLSVIPGVRYEHQDSEYNAVWSTVNGMYGLYGLAEDTTTTKNYGHWFPHLHLKFKPVSWFDLRASAIKTIARPNYYWILPWTRLNAENTRIDRGNPDLKESTSWNFELSSSFYSNTIGLFTIGGFYKRMSDVFFSKTSNVYGEDEIERLQIPGGSGGYQMRSYDNADEARVWGVEIDLQTQLALVPFVPTIFKGILLNVNYARIWSETYYPQHFNDRITDYTTWPPTVTTNYQEWYRKGPLTGQADQILNMSLGYDVGGFSSRVSLMYQGKSLSDVGVIEDEDDWDDDFWRWDASVKYKLNDLIGFYVNLAHIGGQPDRTFFGETDRQTRRSYYGMTGSAGVELKIQ